MLPRQTDNQVFCSQFSQIEKQQIPAQAQPSQPYPVKLENQAQKCSIKHAIYKWKGQLDNQNIGASKQSEDDARISFSNQKTVHRMPPFIVEYVPRGKISDRSQNVPAYFQRRNLDQGHPYFNTYQVNQKSQIQPFKVENLAQVLPQKISQNQANLRFYSGYADCKDEGSEEDYVPQRQLFVLEQQVANQRKKRKYVQRKMWKGICSILDRKYHFNPSVSQYFDQQQLLNPSFTNDQCRLWKNLMNKYVMQIKHNKTSKHKSRHNSVKIQGQQPSAGSTKKRRPFGSKKSISGSRTETLIKKFKYVPPFMPIMVPDLANFPLLYPQAFQTMHQNINLKIEQIQQIRNQINSLIIASSSINKMELNQQAVVAKFIRGFSSQIFNSISNQLIKKKCEQIQQVNEKVPFFLQNLSFEKKVRFLKMLEQSIRFIKNKDNMVDEMIQNCTKIYCELREQNSNSQNTVKNDVIGDLVKQQMIQEQKQASINK